MIDGAADYILAAGFLNDQLLAGGQLNRKERKTIGEAISIVTRHGGYFAAHYELDWSEVREALRKGGDMAERGRAMAEEEE